MNPAEPGNYFGLLPFIAKSLSTGSTLVIDELDAKIHPVLLRYMIMMFNDMSINTHGAQLLFTSHDLSTMNSEVFRRDEIWFAAKGNEENSKLYSLVEYKNENGKPVRKDARFEKQYLEGKYGADPYLRKKLIGRILTNDKNIPFSGNHLLCVFVRFLPFFWQLYVLCIFTKQLGCKV